MISYFRRIKIFVGFYPRHDNKQPRSKIIVDNIFQLMTFKMDLKSCNGIVVSRWPPLKNSVFFMQWLKLYIVIKNYIPSLLMVFWIGGCKFNKPRIMRIVSNLKQAFLKTKLVSKINVFPLSTPIIFAILIDNNNIIPYTWESNGYQENRNGQKILIIIVWE